MPSFLLLTLYLFRLMFFEYLFYKYKALYRFLRLSPPKLIMENIFKTSIFIKYYSFFTKSNLLCWVKPECNTAYLQNKVIFKNQYSVKILIKSYVQLF